MHFFVHFVSNATLNFFIGLQQTFYSLYHCLLCSVITDNSNRFLIENNEPVHAWVFWTLCSHISSHMRICDADFLSHILQGISDAALMSFVTNSLPQRAQNVLFHPFYFCHIFFCVKQDVQWDKMQGEAWFDPSGIDWMVKSGFL